MGGIIAIEYLFPNEFIEFAQTANLIVFKKKPSASWREIPFPYMSVNPAISTSDDQGKVLYNITVTIRIISERLSPESLDVLSTIHARGCIIRYTTAAGQTEIIGSPQYPLYGPLNRIIGKSAKDYTGYELSLKGDSIYPPLPYSEL